MEAAHRQGVVGEADTRARQAVGTFLEFSHHTQDSDEWFCWACFCSACPLYPRSSWRSRKVFFSFFCRENNLSSIEQHQYLLYDILWFLRTNKNNIPNLIIVDLSGACASLPRSACQARMRARQGWLCWRQWFVVAAVAFEICSTPKVILRAKDCTHRTWLR